MKRRKFLQNAGMLSVTPLLPSIASQKSIIEASVSISTRKVWLNYLEKLASPVLTALAADRLKEKMPVETRDPALAKDRAKYTHLEAFGRLLCGIAPWLQADHEDGDENQLLEKFFQLSLEGIKNSVDPEARDYMNWGKEGGQPLVDASFFAYALLRCPKLWEGLNSRTQQQVVKCLRTMHDFHPPENNWRLFAAMIETFFMTINEPFDRKKITYAINRHIEWYKGDGLYGDGAEFHWDYYNSFVIHPYLYDILKTNAIREPELEPIRKQVLEHNRRFAIIQERLIGTDGLYPPIGRSITYRTGAFHHLANMALHHELPGEITPAQVRCALTAVIDQATGAKGMFDDNGWLQIGLYGHQPLLAENYISTGSLYLCSAILLPLGLPASDPFWSMADEDWTSTKIAKGVNLPADHSI